MRTDDGDRIGGRWTPFHGSSHGFTVCYVYRDMCMCVWVLSCWYKIIIKSIVLMHESRIGKNKTKQNKPKTLCGGLCSKPDQQLLTPYNVQLWINSLIREIFWLVTKVRAAVPQSLTSHHPKRSPKWFVCFVQFHKNYQTIFCTNKETYFTHT